MTLANIAANAPPLFLTKNYLNRFSFDAGGITVSSGNGYKHRAYDMTRSSPWLSVGSDDTTTETYNAQLYLGSSQIIRSVDFVALLGVNLKNFLFEYSDDNGVTWSTFTGLNYGVGVTDYTGTDKLATLASAVDMNRIRLSMYKTQTADQEKEVGEIIVGALRFQPTRSLADFDPDYIDGMKTIDMADNSKDYTHLYRSDNSFEMFRAGLTWRGVSSAQRTLFRTFKAEPDPTIFFPFPGDEPERAYYGRIAPDSFKDKFMSKYRNAGYLITFDFEEIGGG